MKFMNDYEINRALRMYSLHPVLGPATQTIANLEEWTNANSDGWAYWPKPVLAAKGVIEMIVRNGTWEYVGDDGINERADATVEEYKRALRALKAFRTRQGADFEIVEPRPVDLMAALKASLR